MDFQIPDNVVRDVKRFNTWLQDSLGSQAAVWYRGKRLSEKFFALLGAQEGYGLEMDGARLVRRPAIREALIAEALAMLSPGLAVAALAHADLGLMALYLYGSTDLQRRYGPPALCGETIMCLGNTENIAGSDVAGIALKAVRTDRGWRLNGSKAYVTNGAMAHLGVITALTDPDAPRTRRISMFLVDLTQSAVRRSRLNKQVWIPSDLTRLEFKDAVVPDDHLLGKRGRGLTQVLSIFTHSRVPISALTLGTARGAFAKAVARADQRRLFGRKLSSFQAKAFEMADLHARMEAARLMLFQACCAMDSQTDFRLEAAMAKYLAVQIAREVTAWAANLFGAASVMFEHPIHKFPMDAWGAALGEGTQDVQKLVVYREMMRRCYGRQPEL